MLLPKVLNVDVNVNLMHVFSTKRLYFQNHTPTCYIEKYRLNENVDRNTINKILILMDISRRVIKLKKS